MTPRQRLAGPSLLCLVVVLFYWKLVLTNQYTWMESPDLSSLVLPWLQFQAGEWHHFRFPLWDPNSWSGQSLFGQAQPGAAYPLNWLLFLAPLKHGWLRESALHWYFVLTRYLAALTAYALARDLGRSRLASILAGCVYALGGYVAATVAPQMVNGAVWTPLVFLYMFRAARGERPWASSLLSGFFLGFGWLAGHHQMNLFVSLAAIGVWIWLCLWDSRPNWKLARLAGASLVIAVLASGFQTLPTAEYGRQAVRWSGAPGDPLHFDEIVPYPVHQEYSLKPLSLLGIIIPNVENGSNPYVGIAAFSLALLGAILAWKEQSVRCLAAVSLAGILFSLGPNSLLHGVLYSLIPLIEKARVPGAATLLFAVGLAPLVAFGVDMLPRPESFAWSRRAGWLLLTLAAVLALASLILWTVKAPGVDDRIMITALCAVLAAGILAGWRAGAISARAGAVSVVGLVLFELANVTNYQLPNRFQPEQNPYLHRMADHSDLVAYIRNQGVAARVGYDSNEITYNIGDWYGLETLNTYAASIPENIWKMDLFSPRGTAFFGVKYFLGKASQAPGFKEVFTGRSGLKVFENINAYPRVWSVHEATSLPSSKVSFDPLRTVLLASEPAPQLGACRPNEEDVQMPLHRPNLVRITANLECRGMVILTDAFYPGWRATVDGKSARIYQVYGGVRGVVVDAGTHVIEMRYRPWSVILGGLMTALAALITILVNRALAIGHA